MTEERKKRSFGRRHVHNIEKTADGSYSYTGPHMVFSEEWEPWKQTLFRLWRASGCGTALTIAAGMFPYETSGSGFHILLPYAGALILQIMILWKLGRIAMSGGRIRSYVYQETVTRFRPLAIAAVALLLIRVGATAVDAARGVIRTGMRTVAVEIALLCGAVLCVGLFAALQKRVVFREEVR